MSRGYDYDDRKSERGQDVDSHPAVKPLLQTQREHQRLRDARTSSQAEIRTRRTQYEITARQLGALGEIGRFRIIATHDLLKHRYQGMHAAMRDDLAHLQRQGLLLKRSISVGKNRDTLVIVALTKEAARLIKQDEHLAGNQAVYAGFVKPAEVPHDAAIYQMYQSEAAQIATKGGKIRRVVLDYELKKEVYSKLSRERDAGALEYARRQQEIAAEHSLPVVDGKIALPDLRIEYETPEGDLEHVDLELATEHYHRGHMDAKTRAGFKMYAFASTSRGRRAQWEGRELTAAVLSL
jgi:hypothetical protein